MSDEWTPSADDVALERFEQTLMTVVRDGAIRQCDWTLRGEGGTDMHDRWRGWAEQESSRELLSDAIPDIVDQTLAVLLNALDSGDIELGWRTDTGWKSLRELGDGELAGTYGTGPPHDPRTYSSERMLPW